MEHTPGPWEVGPTDWLISKRTGMGFRHFPVRSADFDIAIVFSDEDDDEQAANVSLIAAAPELLAALKDLREFVADNLFFGPEATRADQAIAKAEGRGE